MASAQRKHPALHQKSFTDSSGLVWTVEERERPGLSFENERTLVFITQGAFRCVRRYPVSWFDMTAAELEKLSWNY